ncbi:MAG: hypothetical protein K0Q95_3370 [Bacteroidota bacterium]|jgi:hypothetical protein|nr:hypothetical protein [Bacteroidota bacterium]
MHNKSLLTALTSLIAIFAAIAASVGIFSEGGPGPSTITSVRGQEVTLYGKGAYYHMSAEVAPQGIAQDVVTLFIGVPLLLFSLALYRTGSLRGKILLSGTLGYFLTTYLFFTMMAMYNQLFILWVLLLSLAFHAFYISFRSIDEEELHAKTNPRHPVKFIGGFLIFCSLSIGLLWLSVIIPPLLSGSIPKQVEHYTTLVVQALDLSIALPAAFIAGLLLIKRKLFGYKLSAIYLIFLSILMTALSAKVIAMASLGYNVVPVIFIIPTFNLVSIICAMLTIRNITKSPS